MCELTAGPQWGPARAGAWRERGAFPLTTQGLGLKLSVASSLKHEKGDGVTRSGT